MKTPPPKLLQEIIFTEAYKHCSQNASTTIYCGPLLDFFFFFSHSYIITLIFKKWRRGEKNVHLVMGALYD